MNALFEHRSQCPGCHSTSLAEVYRRPYADAVMRDYLDTFYKGVGRIDHERLAGADYVLGECSECGLIFQSEIPNEALLEELYEKWINPDQAYSAYERSNDLRFYVQLERHVEKTVRFLARKPAELKLLDFGMGWGNWCAFALAFGCETFGCELSETRAAHGASRGIKMITLDDVASHQFDMINAEQVFEHLSDPLGVLRRLTGALRPGGLVWIGVPNGIDTQRRLAVHDWSAPKGSANSLNAVAPLEHLNCFSARSLIRMAELAGCELLEIPHRKVLSSRSAMLRHRIGQIKKRINRRDTNEDLGTNLFFRRK